MGVLHLVTRGGADCAFDAKWQDRACASTRRQGIQAGKAGTISL